MNLASHVGGIISPALIKGLQESRPIRTAIVDTIGSSSIPATTTAKPKTTRPTMKAKTTKLVSSSTRKSRTTEAPSTTLIKADKLKFRPEERPEFFGPDSAKAAQNQFPFDSRNNFDFNGGGLQNNGRQFNPAFQGFNPGFFGDRNAFNQGYRPFDSPTDPSGSRGTENTIQGSDGRNPNTDSGSNNGGNRQFGNPDDFDRFRDFGRFGYDDRFQGRFPGGFNSGFRQDERVRFDGYPGPQNGQVNGQNNYRQDPRINYQNALNDPRSLSQYSGAFPFQGYAPNNFDFIPNQRFQNPFGDNYRGQGPSNFPLFYPTGGNSGSGGNARPAFPPLTPGSNSNNGSAAGPLTSASKNSEKLQTPSGDKNTDHILTEAPSAVFHGEKLFYPQLDDYSDLRFRPDAFLINSNFAAKRGINGHA